MSKQITCDVCLNSFLEKSICPFCDSRIDLTINEETEWAVCYTTNDIIEATYIKGLLEGGNIPTQILSQIDSTRMFTVGELAIVKVMIPSPFLDEAKEVINKILNDE